MALVPFVFVAAFLCLCLHVASSSVSLSVCGFAGAFFCLFRVSPAAYGKIIIFSFFAFLLFRAAPEAFGSSQARHRIRAVAACLYHSHSNAR